MVTILFDSFLFLDVSFIAISDNSLPTCRSLAMFLSRAVSALMALVLGTAVNIQGLTSK